MDDNDYHHQPTHCRNCGRSETSDAPLSQCGTCGDVVYCSEECQKNDWPNHKSVCHQRAALLLMWALNDSFNLEMMRRLVRNKPVLNAKLSSYLPPGEQDESQRLEGWTPLHECVRLQNLEALTLMLENGAMVNEVNDKNETPIFLASSLPNAELLKLLLEAGANPNICAKDGTSALVMATREGYQQNVKLLLEHGSVLSLGKDASGRGAMEIAAHRVKDHSVRIHPQESSIEAEENSFHTYNILTEYATYCESTSSGAETT